MNLLPKPLAYAIMGLVSIVWAVNFGAQFVPDLGYQPDPAVHGIFMAIVGGAMVLSHKEAEKPPPPGVPAPAPPPVPEVTRAQENGAGS